jgi:signal transduction histidine kinase
MFGVYQASKVSNEIIIISQEYAPLSEIISDIRFQNSNQEVNLEKIIRFSETNNVLEIEKAKEEFWVSGDIIKSELERGKNIVSAGMEITTSGAYYNEFGLILEKLSKINENHIQYEALANELLLDLEFGPNEVLIEQIKDSDTLIELDLLTTASILSSLANESANQIEINEKDSLTGQIAIITIVGAIAATLGFFISQINSDLKKEVDLKTNELQNANEKLKELDKMKDEFIGIASHELKSPIQPILGFAELAKSGDIDQKEAWDGVLELGTKLQDLANAVLDVSRIESDRLELYLENVRINDLILEITKA